MKRVLNLLLATVGLIALTSCSPVEIGLESVATSASIAASTPLPTEPPTAAARLTPSAEMPTETATLVPQPTVSATPAPTLTPETGPAVVHVAFVGDGNVWLWAQGQGGRALTHTGAVKDVRLSDDARITAFVREDELWMVRTDGTDERRLVGAADLEDIERRKPFDLPLVLHRFGWVPGTHVLAFNTRLRTDLGLVLNDDLHLIDADMQEQILVLPPGEGGEFYCSPDGEQIAIVTAGTIRLIDTDGQNPRAAFTYTPPTVAGEAQYYVHPVWAQDGGSLRVAIPSADPFARPAQASSIWYLHTDGTAARLLASVTAGPRSPYAFSPDLRHVAYLGNAEGVQPGGEQSFMIADLDTGEAVVYYPRAHNVYGWSTDSQYVAFIADTQRPRAHIGRPGDFAIPAYGDPEAVFLDLRWVDASRYLLLVQNPAGWDILLRGINDPGTVVASVPGRQPAYDHAQPATATGQ